MRVMVSRNNFSLFFCRELVGLNTSVFFFSLISSSPTIEDKHALDSPRRTKIISHKISRCNLNFILKGISGLTYKYKKTETFICTFAYKILILTQHIFCKLLLMMKYIYISQRLFQFNFLICFHVCFI